MDPFSKMKQAARESWATFVPFEMMTGSAAPLLVRFAGVQPHTRVLDVGCGTGVVAITAARRGATVTGMDLTPALLSRAKENAELAAVSVEFQEGDVEDLPLADASFDFVLSQFGHMFGPRPHIAVAEMLRVLRPGGTMAFSTWPPHLFIGRMFTLLGQYAPPPPEGSAPPVLWGDPQIVRERLGEAVQDLVFDHGCMLFPALSPAHARFFQETNAGPVSSLVASLSDDADRLAEFRVEVEGLISQYFRDNAVRQDFLMTRATKR